MDEQNKNENKNHTTEHRMTERRMTERHMTREERVAAQQRALYGASSSEYNRQSESGRPQQRKSGTGGDRKNGAQRGNSLSHSKRQKQLQEQRIRLFGGIAAVLVVIVIIVAIILMSGGRHGESDKKNSGAANGSIMSSETGGTKDEEDSKADSGEGQSEKDTAEDESVSAEGATESDNGEGGADDGSLPPVTQEQVPEGTERVYATTVVNIRVSPDTGADVLAKLQAGESILRTANENGWSTVDYNGTTAYISSDFLTTEAPTQTTSQTDPGNAAALGSIASKKVANHEGAWDLNALETTPVNFGYAVDNRDANMIPTDWAWYENQWGQHHVDWIQETDSNTIYLTMDEGFGNETTVRILDTLKEKNVKVVFFITKHFLEEKPEVVQRMIDEGHIIGNHTCTHPDMTSLTLEEAESQIMTLHNMVKEQFGYEMKLFRFPEGRYSDQTLGLVDNLGYKTVFWTFGYNDYSGEPEIEFAKQETVKYLHPGAIYLLHASSETNTEILPYFIDEARARGYEFGVYPVDEDM